MDAHPKLVVEAFNGGLCCCLLLCARRVNARPVLRADIAALIATKVPKSALATARCSKAAPKDLCGYVEALDTHHADAG